MYQSQSTAQNSWRWAERLPKTCRVIIPIKLDFSASVDFIHKEEKSYVLLSRIHSTYRSLFRNNTRECTKISKIALTGGEFINICLGIPLYNSLFYQQVVILSPLCPVLKGTSWKWHHEGLPSSPCQVETAAAQECQYATFLSQLQGNQDLRMDSMGCKALPCRQ